MGQFKPMVKMTTTEPSVELKLKKGGSVKMKVKEHDGHKMMDGGVPPAMPPRGPMGALAGAAPKKPSLAMRRKAMRAMPAAAAPAGPVGMAGRMMKKGGSCEEKLKAHADKPASKAHKGLKTGGVAMGQAGFKKGGVIGVAASKKGASGYANTKMHEAHRDTKGGSTGSVKMGKPAGYKKGGECYAEGGKVKGMGVENNVSTTPAGETNTKTGGVRMGNAGGFKKGGATKKAADGGKKGGSSVKASARKYADGGYVDSENNVDPYAQPLPENMDYSDPRYDQFDPNGPYYDIAMAKRAEAMKQAEMAGANPQVLRGSTGPGRVTTQGPGDGLAPGPIRGFLQNKANMVQKVMNSPMVQRFISASKQPVVVPKPPMSMPQPRPSIPAAKPLMPMMPQKKYATGGSVQDDGKPEKMPQGHKRPPTPVSINQLSGTYKKGGSVK